MHHHVGDVTPARAPVAVVTLAFVGERRVVVLGGSIAGLAAALILARRGHKVTVVERDPIDAGPPEEAHAWTRRGIPHFLQPHAFIPRGRAELKTHLPDVYDGLLAAGARDVDLRPKLPGGDVRPEDEILQYIAVRRPLIEWGLRRAAWSEPRIEFRAGVDVTGLVVERGRVLGARLDGTHVEGDIVVDALGRRSPTPAWLAASGITEAPAESSDCGVIYYCRYYRQRPEFDLPDGPFLLSPRGDLGYFAYATFPGDNRTFAALLAAPTGVSEWRRLVNPAAFEIAVSHIPALRAWVDPDGVDPITDVMPMAGLRNSIRAGDTSPPVALASVGDAACHTDPVLAHGLSFALIHARELARALDDHDDAVDAVADFAATTGPALRERYDLATALDEQRLRMWRGEAVDFAHHDGDYALFSMSAAAAVALTDPDVFRVFVRRIGLLDSTAVLDGDIALRQRIETQFEALMKTRRSAPGPSRDDMLAAVTSAVST